MQKMWWGIVLAAVAAASVFAGCDRSPSNLGAEFHKGRCVVCKRGTQVSDRVQNPISGYKVEVCWRKDCQLQYGAQPMHYVDQSKMPTQADIEKALGKDYRPIQPPVSPAAPR